ncbi:MAG: hypothetical protein ACK5MD_09120 [Flavobacteriales bacterium]
MASSYLPEETYVVCTNQIGNSYRQLVADDKARNISVYYKDKRAFLTKVDKKLLKGNDFTCKTVWSKGLSESAFVGGVGVALGIAAASMTVPVVGWIVGTAIAIGAIAYAIYQIATSPKCSGALGNKLSQWKFYHTGVRFNNHNAILSCSILVCGEGGVLMPFVSEKAAEKAASSIGWNNKVDIGLNTVVNAFAGFVLAEGAVAITGIYSALMYFGGTGFAIFLGKEVIKPSADWVGEQYANQYRDKRYNEIEEEIIKKEEEKDLLDHVMDANNPIEDSHNVIGNASAIRQALVSVGASKDAISSFDSAVAEAKKTGTFGKDNPKAQQVLKDIKSGKYGADALNALNALNGKRGATGLHTQKTYDKITQLEKEKVKLNKYKTLKQTGRGSLTILGIFQPFISAVFDKRALIKAIEYQETKEEENERNGISVISTNY